MNGNGNGTNLLAIVTMVCHTLVLLFCIVGVVILAADRIISAGAYALIAAIGGLTGSGLVINGRKYNSGGS